MGNNLFQRAKSAVHRADTSAHSAITSGKHEEAQTYINVAKNEVSSAFANSTPAEQGQLQELQQRLDEAQAYLSSNKAKH